MIFFDIFIPILLGITIFLFIKTILFNRKTKEIDKKQYKKIKWYLILFQIINIFFTKERLGWQIAFLPELLLVLSLILNTISLIIFNIKYNKQRKEIQISISIMSILVIICGMFFVMSGTLILYDNIKYGYDKEIRQILYLETYTKQEAQMLLDNLRKCIPESQNGDCRFTLGTTWEESNENNTYGTTLYDIYEQRRLPTLKIKVDSNDKTKIEKIYWQFNDEIKITYYENGSCVNNFEYLYYAALDSVELSSYTKETFEKEVKSRLKSPSSAQFTYGSFTYNQETNTFIYYGWVESQNEYAAMIRKDFFLHLQPNVDKDGKCLGVKYEMGFVEDEDNSNNTNSSNNSDSNNNRNNNNSNKEITKQQLAQEYQTTLQQRTNEYEENLKKAKEQVRISKEALDISGGYLSKTEYDSLYKQATSSVQRELLLNRYNMSVTYDKMVNKVNEIEKTFYEWKNTYTQWYQEELGKLGY